MIRLLLFFFRLLHSWFYSVSLFHICFSFLSSHHHARSFHLSYVRALKTGFRHIRFNGWHATHRTIQLWSHPRSWSMASSKWWIFINAFINQSRSGTATFHESGKRFKCNFLVSMPTLIQCCICTLKCATMLWTLHFFTFFLYASKVKCWVDHTRTWISFESMIITIIQMRMVDFNWIHNYGDVCHALPFIPLNVISMRSFCLLFSYRCIKNMKMMRYDHTCFFFHQTNDSIRNRKHLFIRLLNIFYIFRSFYGFFRWFWGIENKRESS